MSKKFINLGKYVIRLKHISYFYMDEGDKYYYISLSISGVGKDITYTSQYERDKDFAKL